MTVRTLNYTRRRRLMRDDMEFIIDATNMGDHIFHARLKLEAYDLPADSRVFVEAYRQTHWMRFDLGTVAHTVLPPDRRLLEFDTLDGVLFRVRVTSSSEPKGLLLAEGDRIPFRTREERPATKVSLLPVMPMDLGEEICKVSYEDNRPVLLVNSTIGNWRSLALDPVVVALIYPPVFREILTRIVFIEEELDLDDKNDWRTQWCKFAERLPNVEALPDQRDTREDWIDSAVEGFSRRNAVITKFNLYWKEGAAT